MHKCQSSCQSLSHSIKRMYEKSITKVLKNYENFVKCVLLGKVGQSSTHSGNKYPLLKPITMPNFIALRQELCKISAVNNLGSRKSGPKFVKIGEDLLRTNAPHHVTFHRDAPGGPPGPKLTNLVCDVQQSPLFQPSKFQSVLKTPLQDICCQTSSILVTAKQTVNDIVSASPRGD